MRPIATACLLAGVTLLVYGFRLSGAPIGADEAVVLHESLLQDDDSAGTRTPVFFRVTDERWLLPVPVYATATLRAIGGGNVSARFATVIVAALDVALLSLVAGIVFGSPLAAFVAALLLLMMPAHVSFGRSGVDAIYPVPFLLAAILAVLSYLKTDRPWLLLLAGACLGAGIYTHRSAPLTMTFLLVLCGVTLMVSRRRVKPAVLLTAGFAALLLPALMWFAFHQETYRDTFGRWAIHLAHVRNPLDGVRAFLNWNTLGNRASLYWGFLDPAWLFFDRTAPLLLAMLPAFALGISKWPRVLGRDAMVLIAGGAVIAPLAGSSFGEPHYASSAVVLLPCAALLMTAGVVYGVRQPSRPWRAAMAVLGLLIAVEGTATYLRTL
jgi:4-amino-4-deoxy-L-arabinose transferase-like glycosyltransferase